MLVEEESVVLPSPLQSWESRKFPVPPSLGGSPPATIFLNSAHEGSFSHLQESSYVEICSQHRESMSQVVVCLEGVFGSGGVFSSHLQSFSMFIVPQEHSRNTGKRGLDRRCGKGDWFIYLFILLYCT